VRWSLGRGVSSPAYYGVWGSAMSSTSGVWGKALAANAFSAYSRPQDSSHRKKNVIVM